MGATQEINNINLLVKKLDEKTRIANILRQADLRAISPESLEAELITLLDGYKIFGLARTMEQVWHRVRPVKSIDKIFTSLRELIYPETGNDSYGRANLPGSTVMYGSWNLMTAIDEKEIQEGDIFQSITYRPIEGAVIPCHVVGDYQSFNNSGRCIISNPPMESTLSEMLVKQPQEFLVGVFVDSFLAEFFARINAVSYDYKISAVYSELLMTNGGVIFPSTKNRGSMNMAVSSKLFDDKFEVITTEVFRLDRTWGYGIHTCTPLKGSCDFDENGNIVWSDKGRKYRWSPQTGIDFDRSPGWRKKGQQPKV